MTTCDLCGAEAVAEMEGANETQWLLCEDHAAVWPEARELARQLFERTDADDA